MRRGASLRRDWSWFGHASRAKRRFDEIIPEFPHRSRKFAALGKNVIERIDEHVDFLFSDDKRRQNLHHIHGVPGNLREDTMLAQHLCHDHLREQHLVDLVQKFPRHLQFELLWFMKLDPDHEPQEFKLKMAW